MKKTIRNEIIEKREKLGEEDLRKNSDAIKESLLCMKEISEANTIALYYSKDNEVLTDGIIDSLVKGGKKICLPKVAGEKGKKEKKMEFRMISSLEDLEPGFAGIMEPKKSCPSINPSELDLVVMPCVAIDKDLNRIGRGGGMYDHFLAENNKHRIKTICLAHGFQLKDSLPAEAHDQKADALVTEKGIIRGGKPENNPPAPDPKIIYGKPVAQKLFAEAGREIKRKKLDLCLAVILAGEDPASESYVKIKFRRCEEVGIRFMLIRMAASAKESEVIEQIEKLNKDKAVTGILVQLPLPAALTEATDRIINAVLPEKDVDGLTENSMKKLMQGDESLAPCTPGGIIKLLEEYHINLSGKKIVIVGRGRLVGKPLGIMLKNRQLDFEVCHTKTDNLEERTSQADVLISATGSPHLITEKHIRKGAVVIDAGTAKLGERLVGDVDFESVKEKASLITPVPGGVGPMTIAMLIRNTINAYHAQHAKLNK